MPDGDFHRDSPYHIRDKQEGAVLTDRSRFFLVPGRAHMVSILFVLLSFKYFVPIAADSNQRDNARQHI